MKIVSTVENALRRAAFGDLTPGSGGVTGGAGPGEALDASAARPFPVVGAHAVGAAFGGPSVDALRGTAGVPDMVITAAGAGGALTRWLAAVVFGAHGRYAAAASLLEPLCRDRDPGVAALAGAALAAHRRQLGGHAEARRLDGLAVRQAIVAARAGTHRRGPNEDAPEPDEDGLDPAGALVDALLGLAADNLALGRVRAARAHLDRAAAVPPTSWRSTVRLGWVRAELALASGRPSDSVSPAKRARALARERGAVRHRVKSELVLAAALAATGRERDRARAAALVRAAADESRARGLRSLSWPAALLAADLDPAEADWNRAIVTDELYGVLLSTDPVGRRCARRSPWVPI